MRRNNMGRRSAGGPGPGPLMTGHLQDIDLELELLKRKREMIEQQQQLLVMEQQFNAGRQFDQSRFMEPQQHGSDRDYTHLYENRPNQNQFGRKRQAETQWQYDGSFKKNYPKKKPAQFTPRQGPKPRRSGPTNFQSPRPVSGPGQAPKNSAPFAPAVAGKGKQSIGQRIASQKYPPRPQREFAPTKVSKPKASVGPNKLASLPLAERKALVGGAKESVSQSDVSLMLLPDRAPSHQVSGRLELALGAIMKHVRQLVGEDSPNSFVLHSMQLQRVMKQAIRERIRTVMLGKVVGTLMEILAIYREEFPEETDADIVNLAVEAAAAPSGQVPMEQSAEPQNQSPVKPPPAEATQTVKHPHVDESFRKNLNYLIGTKLQEMFDKLAEIYSKDNNEESEVPKNGTGDEKMDETEEQKNAQPNNEEQKEAESNNEEQKDAQPNNEEQKESQKASVMKEPEDYEEFLNMDIKVRDIVRVIPRFLRQYTPYLIKLINFDKSFRRSVADLHANPGVTLAPPTQNNNAANTPQRPQQQKDARYNLPYYVKVMAKPSLPKRKQMQNFLNQFNPKSIKKHRTIHNLLFVGLSEKTDFDAIVAADGTTIGRATVSVRICTNSTTGPMDDTNENNETDVTMNESQNTSQISEPKSEGDLSSDLEGQITDLLTSIRKETDESVENVQENTVETEKAEDAETGKADDSNDKPVKEETLPTDDQFTEESKEMEETEEVTNESQDTTQANIENEITMIKEPEANEPENPGENTDTLESNGEAKTENENNIVEETNEQMENDKVAELKKNSGRSTPTRASARVANVTPSSIRTRRASSRLNQN